MAENSKLVSIGQAAKQAGVSRQTLQYYIMLGLIDPTQTTPTGRRLFNEDTIHKIKLVKKLNETGYTLRGIRELFISGHEYKGSSHE